jgi:hypothetical protein
MGIFILFVVPAIIPSIDASYPNVCDTEHLGEYTWSYLRYGDSVQNKVNGEWIHVSDPTHGSLMVLANMMTPEVCRVALEVYCNNSDGSLDKLKTLENLAAYVNESTIHIGPGGIPDVDEWMTNAVNKSRKTLAFEMSLVGNYLDPNGKHFIGDCFSLSTFCTSILRLCGFSVEDVFNVNIGNLILGFNIDPFLFLPYPFGHEVNLIDVDDTWYVIDSTGLRNETGGRLFSESEYQIGHVVITKNFDLQNGTWIPRIFVKDRVSSFENDYYFIGYSWQGITDPFFYGNMDKQGLRRFLNSALNAFRNAKLTGLLRLVPSLYILRLSLIARSNPNILCVPLPYTIEDAQGETVDEKAKNLALLNREFILNQTSPDGVPNQYDKAIYSYGLLGVKYPQVYAKSARLAGHTSIFGQTHDRKSAFDDMNDTITWIRHTFVEKQTVAVDQIAFPDLTYLLKNGSTVDQALFAYGALRNMKKEGDFWPPHDLFVIVTNDTNGYLAVHISDEGWNYLNFGDGPLIQTQIDNVSFAFNEQIKVDVWDPQKFILNVLKKK